PHRRGQRAQLGDRRRCGRGRGRRRGGARRRCVRAPSRHRPRLRRQPLGPVAAGADHPVHPGVDPHPVRGRRWRRCWRWPGLALRLPVAGPGRRGRERVQPVPPLDRGAPHALPGLRGVDMNVVEGARGYRIDSTWAALPVGLSVEETEPGRWVLRVAARGAERVRLTLPCGLDEHFAGLGEQFTQVDKRGRVIEAKIGASVNESCHLAPGLDGGYKVAPLWYSSAGYAAFVSGTRPVRIEFAVRDPHLVVIDLAHAEREVTVIEAPPAVAIETVTALTGRPPLAPPWTYAPWKASRGGHDAAVAEVERLRAEGVGAGAIWLDAHYEEGTNSGFLCAGTYELGEYPDISATVAALHELGVMVLTYVNPF